MIYSVRNDWETNEKLILRYKKLFFQSRIANKIKSERYNERPLNNRKIRLKAIVRAKYRELNNKVYF